MAGGTATPRDENGAGGALPDGDFSSFFRPRVFKELWVFPEELDHESGRTLTPRDEAGDCWLWRAWILRPVPGLGGRYDGSPTACAVGYDLSPFRALANRRGA